MWWMASAKMERIRCNGKSNGRTGSEDVFISDQLEDRYNGIIES
jgi:hypothetical protein